MSRRALVLLLALAAPLAFAAGEPTGLSLSCGGSTTTNPLDCTTWGPTFSWTPNGTQAIYEIQIDKDSTFASAGGCPWFADYTPTTNKTTASFMMPTAGQTGATCGTGATVMQLLWRANRTLYWRVRTKDDEAHAWQDWSATAVFSYQQLPGPPTGISVTDGDGTGEGGPGTAPSVTTYDVTNDASLASRIAAANPGDVIRLASGTYSSDYTVSRSGNAANPITIRPATTATMSGKLTLTGSYLVVGPGITFTNGSAAALSESGSYQLVTGCTFTGHGTSSNGNDLGVVSIGSGSSTSNWFIGNTIAPDSAIAASAALITPKPGTTDIVIRGNDLSGAAERGINQTGGQSTLPGNSLVAENHIHELTLDSGVGASSYYGMGDVTYARNLIYDVKGGYGVEWVRGTWPRFIGNTFGRDDAAAAAMYCYKYGTADGQTTIAGDSCLHTNWAFQLSPDAWTTSHTIQYAASNHYWRTGRSHDGLVDNTATCGASYTGTACVTYVTTGAGKITAVDPQLVTTLGATVGRPSSSSNPLRNLGPAGYPVAVDGDGTADIGRFAFGAAAITSVGTYTYDPRWTISTTKPRVSWTFSDPNNTLMSINPAQTQGAWEAQVDPASTFDTAGPFQPFCSSGKTSSTQAYWDVPCTLAANTTYYVRVRTWDNVTDQPGAWSDYAAAFRTGSASTPARVSGATLRGVVR